MGGVTDEEKKRSGSDTEPALPGQYAIARRGRFSLARMNGGRRVSHRFVLVHRKPTAQ
jgi:hypothetical protein